ncbi:ABC transporter permease [Prosthecomicrobium hirschii]|uniref:Sugar ABC transporter permease n=1 Tax=Prosthecodimorpha hirschii TaxID=665126 RepID=A0A0P6WBF1_9HYPH|nr:ABC transporter permease [Prosthecomicrobium hirschii]KPL51928.1 sugar ABC transporter permease [Prosthecomicrobium hirschii]MCW1843722.1 ABC transporter permease [Prosthecomicrobium hirschii]TPQ51806.1 ABC transporter permease [Prosthecomicrobium hirschii]
MTGSTPDWLIRLRQNAGLASAIALFAAFYLVYNMAHPKGFSPQVFVQNADEAFALVMVAMAQTLPVLLGGLDLSVGAVMTMVNCLASHLVVGSPLQIFFGMTACIAAGAAFGFMNGCIVVYGRIQPIITTLATGAIAIGIALFLRPKPGGKVDEDLSWALTNGLGDFAETYHLFDDGKAAWFQPIAGIPVAFVLLILVVLIIWVPFRRTVIGRTVYAVGSAEGAAFMSGLPVNQAKLAAFTLAGVFAAIGGLFLAIQTSSGNADIPQANSYTLNSIAAVVLGGTSLLGGSGSAIGSLFGALILRVISFNFRIFDIPPLMQSLVEGLILLAAVSLGGLRVLRIKNRLELFR